MVDTVREIHVFPVHGEPGSDLTEAEVEREGLAGDRRKKAPVQVVSTQDVRADTRANLVVSVPSAVLAQSVGGVLVVGDVELDVTGAPSSCPGVYAAVRRPGTVRVGDLVTMSPEPGVAEPGVTAPDAAE
jgi:uncharacterized protein YcbX